LDGPQSSRSNIDERETFDYSLVLSGINSLAGIKRAGTERPRRRTGERNCAPVVGRTAERRATAWWTDWGVAELIDTGEVIKGLPGTK